MEVAPQRMRPKGSEDGRSLAPGLGLGLDLGLGMVEQQPQPASPSAPWEVVTGGRSRSSSNSSDPGDSVWSRLFRHLTIQRPLMHRLLPKLKAGKLLLEIGEPAEWTQYEIVLAGSNIGDLGLYYYANKTDEAPQGCIYLHSAHIDVLEEILMVVTKERTWFLCAEHGREASDWAEAICASIDKLSLAVLLRGKTSKRRRLTTNVSPVTLREIQSREPKARVDEFLEIFVKSTREDICLQAMKGAFVWSCMRNIAWKLWLNYLPQDKPFRQWVSVAHTKRKKYEAARSKHVEFRDFCDGMQDDQEFIAMCESSEDLLFHNIYKDVRRTRGNMPFFHEPAVQCMLVRILYTYSSEYPEISYNQGMSELLATIVYLLYIEQWQAQPTKKNTNADEDWRQSVSTDRSDETDSDDASYVYVESFINVDDDSSCLDREAFLQMKAFSGGSGKYYDCCREAAEEIVRELTDGEFLEHDAYLLLEEVMFRMAGTYCPDVTPQWSSGSSGAPQSPTLGLLSSENASSPLYDQMNSIHNHILSRCDPPTARHLSGLGVEPQMFLLRWVRVLMSREYEMAQVWQIWDAIFSLTPGDFSFINLLCVAAVREFREDILSVEDATSVFMCLRDISERLEADRLVDNAKELYEALIIAAAVEATNEASSSSSS